MQHAECSMKVLAIGNMQHRQYPICHTALYVKCDMFNINIICYMQPKSSWIPRYWPLRWAIHIHPPATARGRVAFALALMPHWHVEVAFRTFTIHIHIGHCHLEFHCPLPFHSLHCILHSALCTLHFALCTLRSALQATLDFEFATLAWVYFSSLGVYCSCSSSMTRLR